MWRGFAQRLLPTPVLLASALFPSAAAAQAARETPLLDVAPSAQARVDVKVTERLVALETADVDVPPPPGVGFRPPLYFRIREISPGSLRVELWELGKPHGARAVSSSGTKALEGRRISLAAAELARQLRSRRIAELAALEDTDGAEHAQSGGNARLPLHARFVWTLGGRGAVVPSSDTWFLGPSADVVLAFDGGQRIAVGGAWLAGLTSDETSRWFEVRLAASQSFALGSATEFAVGLDAAIASARFSGAASGGALALDAATGRAGLFARADFRLGSMVVLGVGSDVGVILHPLTLEGESGNARFSGVWLGGALTLAIDPAP
jgi:hypothetical protein